MIKKEDSLGIPNYGIHYLKMPLERNSLNFTLAEFEGIHNFINQELQAIQYQNFKANKKDYNL